MKSAPHTKRPSMPPQPNTDIQPSLAGAPRSRSASARQRERTAIRNVSVLVFLRGLILAGGVATALLIPRTLGPAIYGRYDLVTMLTFWFSMLGGLGMGQVLSRQTPQLLHEGATDKLRALVGSLLALRVLTSVVVAMLYLLVTRLWLRDLSWAILIPLSLAVFLRGPASYCYSIFLGQGRIARWAVPEVIRQWGSVVFALPCFLFAGLRGAVIGFLLAETTIFLVALTGLRQSIPFSKLRVDRRVLRDSLAIGLAFYSTDLVGSGIERSGAVLLRIVTHDYAQVGLFGVSQQIFMSAVLSTSQLTSSFVPLITVLRTSGEGDELRLWLGRMVKWLAVAGTLAFLASLVLGKDVVPMVLGRAYASVAPNLIVFTAALLFLPLTSVCSVVALTHDRPSLLLKSALLRLVCLWGAGVPLVARWGSLGACVAYLVSMIAQAAYLGWVNRQVMGTAIRRWVLVVSAGLALAPVALLRASLPVNLLCYLAVVGVYLGVLHRFGAISLRELRAVLAGLGLAKPRPEKTAEVAS